MSKRSISPYYEWDIYVEKYPIYLYTLRNPRKLDSQLPKTVYCGLETITYKQPQLW